MEIAIKLFQFILSISILVILHELGHFLPAKWFKTKVEKFYLFFDPWFSIVKKKIGETEYGIGWLPFGGYVKIAGMVDESMDTEQLKQPAQPWEFRAKPAWQRLIIMLGGVTVNFFLAWLIFSSLSFFNGETYGDLSKFENGIGVSDAARKMGFQNGDKIINIDGKPVKRLENASINTLLSDEVTVLRNGKEVTFQVNDEGIAQVVQQKQMKMFVSPRFPFIVDSLASETSRKSGLMKGDKIVGVNNEKIRFFDEATVLLEKNKNKTIQLEIIRNDASKTISIPVDKDGKLGVSFNIDVANAEMKRVTTTQQYSFLQAIPRGFERSIESLTMQVKQFKIIFNNKIKGYKNVGGPLAIINNMQVEKSADGSLAIDWAWFWGFTAMFSVWLAFLNLIPIPGLDGGHVIFTLYEMIVGKPVPQKVLENAQMVGVIFLLGLMLLIFGADIFKIITNKF